MSDRPTYADLADMRDRALIAEKKNEQLERELAEAKFDLQFRRDLYALQSKELAEAREELIQWRTLRSWGGTPQIIDDFIKGQQSRIHAAQDAERQRDTLAEALEMVATHTYADGQCDNGYSPQYVAKQALAAVKGGSHD